MSGVVYKCIHTSGKSKLTSYFRLHMNYFTITLLTHAVCSGVQLHSTWAKVSRDAKYVTWSRGWRFNTRHLQFSFWCYDEEKKGVFDLNILHSVNDMLLSLHKAFKQRCTGDIYNWVVISLSLSLKAYQVGKGEILDGVGGRIKYFFLLTTLSMKCQKVMNNFLWWPFKMMCSDIFLKFKVEK